MYLIESRYIVHFPHTTYSFIMILFAQPSSMSCVCVALACLILNCMMCDVQCWKSSQLYHACRMPYTHRHTVLGSSNFTHFIVMCVLVVECVNVSLFDVAPLSSFSFPLVIRNVNTSSSFVTIWIAMRWDGWTDGCVNDDWRWEKNYSNLSKLMRNTKTNNKTLIHQANKSMCRCDSIKCVLNVCRWSSGSPDNDFCSPAVNELHSVD